MKSIQTEVIIKVAPSVVWGILTDFARYPEWNPFIRIRGNAEAGIYLKNTIYLEGHKPQVFRPQVLTVKPEREFRWQGNLLVKGLFDGEHYFILEKTIDGHTRLLHGENFTGILTRLIFKMIGEKTQQGFEKMNAALKQQCEAAALVSRVISSST